jgi:diguanylate cyclase (GGDEF)-like protein
MSSVAGVCYTDINGLKAINAREGHDAGDEKIKEAADIVASVFKRKNCYRIGGDEFLAIIPEITQEKFEEQVKKLRTKLAKVSAAIGSVWIEDSGEINKAVKRADERMYEDKAAYYKDKEHERRGKHEQEEQEE